jgi:hypothetical protein
VSDDTTNPAPNEPEPGTTEWLLAQLSGGRIDSRRERREAEAALEAAGVPLPDAPADASQHGAAPAESPLPLPAAEAEQHAAAAGEPGPEGAAGQPFPGVPSPEQSAPEQSAPQQPSPEQPLAEEKPRARFSWETGTLQAVEAEQPGSAEQSPSAEQPGFAEQSGFAGHSESAEVPPPVGAAERPAAAPASSFPLFTAPASVEPASPVAAAAAVSVVPAGTVEPAADSSATGEPAIPFMWNLLPTDEPDPAVNPHAELTEPVAAPEFRVASAAPLVVPRPRAAPAGDDLPNRPAGETGSAERPEPALPDAGEDARAAAAQAPGPAAPASVPPASGAVPTDSAPTDAPTDSVSAEPSSADATPSPPAHAPLPPGTTAHEFDPFAPDIFTAPPAANTPVPSVDEFTIPDEGSPAPASGPSAHAPEPAEPEDAAEPETHEVTSDWSDIADILGAHPETVDTAIVSPMPPVNEILPSFDAVLPRSAAAAPAEVPPSAGTVAGSASPVRPPNAPIEHGRGGGRLNRWLLIAAAVLLAILIAVALFTLGRSVAAGNDQTPVAASRTSTPSPVASSASPTPTPTPTATDDQAVAGTGPLAPGQSYPWDQLRGGECIDPFSSAWAQEFTIVDCNAQHAAQLVYTAPFATDPAAAFPGEQAISSQINQLCTKPGVVDLHAAAAYSDVQLVGAYPATAEQWDKGQRSYFCFVTRASGQPFTSSIAGPGPTS